MGKCFSLSRFLKTFSTYFGLLGHVFRTSAISWVSSYEVSFVGLFSHI